MVDANRVNIKSPDTSCSWCEKRVPAAKYVIAGGHGLNICNECVDLCNDILTDEIGDWAWRRPPTSEIFLMTRNMVSESRELLELLDGRQPLQKSAEYVERLRALLSRLLVILPRYSSAEEE
jgi:hypothetical protein